MRLIIHRGAHQVGGSCVELNCRDSTILIDVGLPLEYNFGDDLKYNLPQPLFRELEGGGRGRWGAPFTCSPGSLWSGRNVTTGGPCIRTFS